jgi:hypothetical protein
MKFASVSFYCQVSDTGSAITLYFKIAGHVDLDKLNMFSVYT